MTGSKKTPKSPFHESNIVWGSIGISCGVMCVIISPLLSDLRYLLIVPGVFFQLIVWYGAKRTLQPRLIGALGGVLVVGSLFAVAEKLPPIPGTLSAICPAPPPPPPPPAPPVPTPKPKTKRAPAIEVNPVDPPNEAPPPATGPVDPPTPQVAGPVVQAIPVAQSAQSQLTIVFTLEQQKRLAHDIVRFTDLEDGVRIFYDANEEPAARAMESTLKAAGVRVNHVNLLEPSSVTAAPGITLQNIQEDNYFFASGLAIVLRRIGLLNQDYQVPWVYRGVENESPSSPYWTRHDVEIYMRRRPPAQTTPSAPLTPNALALDH